ncbi:HEAT repeat-containing protein 6-like [Biomphalaria glabrata]|uniref:HEAT repeat-containing protein 6 n=1 Tax=Biomphalaria glabrata TaxID=6526 RepID=A0A9W2YJ49_BIOGL|nr:HEAT repeat-containing protein 6-like [Biomphalaria glabrata]
MASPRSKLDEVEAQKFRDNLARLKSFFFQDDEKTKAALSLILDELIAVDSSVCKFIHEYEGSELLARLCHSIPIHLERIVVKLCLVITNFITHKNVILSSGDLHTVVQFLTQALLQTQSFIHSDILRALSAVCENNSHRIEKFHDVLVGGQGLLLHLTDDTTNDEEVVVEAVRCLAVFTSIRPNYAEHIEVRYLSASFDTLVHLLHRAPNMKMASHLQNKLLMYCFSGIQNIIVLKRLPNIELGILFAAVRAYMFYGLTSQTVNIPTQLYPNVVTPYDPLASSKTPKQTGNFSTTPGESKSSRGRGRGGGAIHGDRIKRQRKKKDKAKGDEAERETSQSSLTGGTHRSTDQLVLAGTYSGSWSTVTPDEEALTWDMTWLKFSSSDSEYSDTEGGRVRQHRSEAVKVRQCALNCFLNIVRVVDKRLMFGYWSSFIPDVGLSNNASQTQSLFTTILKDPSPKCRMAAVASLTAMLESTKPYLAAAEEITPHQAAFTPFSAILGSMIREMHRCLVQALVAENYKAVLTQIIKCLANLVNNAPYHRLNPGLLTRVLKQIRHFYNHKDPNVRTACLTCIGSIVGIKPPLMEVSQLIKPPHPPLGVNRSANPGDSPLFRPEDASYLLYPSFATPQVSKVAEEADESEREAETLTPCISVSEPDKSSGEIGSDPQKSDVDELCINPCLDTTAMETLGNNSKDVFESGDPCDSILGKKQGPEVLYPVLGASGGSDTPVYTDHILQAHARETSWVIKLCVKNITGQPDLAKDDIQSRKELPQKYEPLPVRLEALQVMSNLIKNYFPVIRQSFHLLKNLVQMCLEDTNYIIKLHGSKVLDEFTQVLQRDIQDASIAPSHVIPFEQILDFWLYLLEDPLPKLLNYNPELTTEGNNLVRSGACECMANIGEGIFSKLPHHRQMQCVTLVLGLADDEDKLIKASAVRALGIYVMYACLKDDVAFIMDAGRAILRCMESSSNSVRFKAAWAMANLCDTLVSNKENHVEEFLLEFPESMVLQLVQCAASSSKDSDKISCNSVRAIGNLLRFLTAASFQQPDMQKAVDTAVKGLVKNMTSGTMKVRWNSCYAASNAFQNSHLPLDKPWLTDILTTLSKVVQNSSNFKVRINAALALSSVQSRQQYGSKETFCDAWISLVCALESAENINDFAEYKYKDSLTEHLCGAVLRLTTMIEVSDLSLLSQSVLIKGHTFRTYMERYIHLESKKAQINVPKVENIKCHLEKLLTEATTEEQRRCVVGLLQACLPELDSTDERTPEKSSFQQIYD